MQVEEYNLNYQRELMAVIEAVRKRKKINIATIRKASGISMNSFYAWLRCARCPIMRHVTALADAFGFEIVMRRTASPHEEYDMRDMRAAMTALDAERRKRGMTVFDMEAVTGISFNSFYAWRSRARSPAMCNAVAIAQTFGFEIYMRRVAPEPFEWKSIEFKNPEYVPFKQVTFGFEAIKKKVKPAPTESPNAKPRNNNATTGNQVAFAF